MRPLTGFSARSAAHAYAYSASGCQGSYLMDLFVHGSATMKAGFVHVYHIIIILLYLIAYCF